jgi:hypothetical protein
MRRKRIRRTRAQKKAALAQRKALSVKNIQEDIAIECKKAIHRNKSMKSYSLQTNPEILKKIYVSPPKQGTE